LKHNTNAISITLLTQLINWRIWKNNWTRNI